MAEALDLLHQLVGRDDEPILWWQMWVRATVIMLVGLVLVRVAGKRMFGKWGAIDTVVAVILGSNLSRTLTGGAPFLPTLSATALLVLLHGVFSALAVRFSWLGPAVKGRSVRIVSDGEPDQEAMRRQGVGTNDLEEALRKGGVLDCRDVKEAWIERDGQISVVRR
ncbi:conserved hypothetical protein [Phenylobacterium zucineum HLK1]|uniref:YetF C-terminal domain-containing protein n=1 Tax=Phenylobacterium zucineum (strain HLK1) TaxID=450851 RepID=B4RAS2_PHEZH|nr:YetF domain-containing protein [Phenylobacterium zucineum]ACG79670.1 conserved hypothetical protein [Phenylobacterium zucineum HLK1]